MHDETYLALLRDILTNGTVKSDRTGTGMTEVFGRQMKFDLSDGFPLLTIKSVNFRAIANELLWMVGEGSTDVKWLQDRGHSFWNDWQLSDGTIGKGYGYQFRRIEHVQINYPKQYENSKYKAPFDTEIKLDFSHNKYGYVGKEFQSNNYGAYVITVEHKPTVREKNTTFDILFLDTGYKTVVCHNQIKSGEIRDPWYPRVWGVGYLGDYKVDPITHKLWHGMLDRCYNTSSQFYRYYGGRGVRVHDDWLCFANYQRDIKTLEGYSLKLEYPKEYTIDKDVQSGILYSKETCIWSSKVEQTRNRKGATLYKATHTDGRQLTAFGFKGLQNATGCCQGNFHKLHTGNLKTVGGWTIKEIETEGHISVRIIDQVKTLIADLKHNPNSRRMIINLWNPGDLNQMSLPPCHMMTQWNVTDGKLNCQMYQRSVDTGLGLPFNIAFYSLFIHMLAHIVDLAPGTLTWVGGSCHIYSNHMEQVKEQLSRTPFDSPTLTIRKDAPKDIDSFKLEDFILEGYQCHPPIKAPIAV